MTPTAKALELHVPLGQALDQLRSTLQDEEFAPARARLTVAIASTDYIQVVVVVMPLALALRREAPGVRVAVRHLNPAMVEQQLASGEVDVAVVSPVPDRSHLRARRLFDETYVLMGRRGHPGLRTGLPVEEFVELEFVIVSRRAATSRRRSTPPWPPSGTDGRSSCRWPPSSSFRRSSLAATSWPWCRGGCCAAPGSNSR
jgi:DNA-binding transcriptional LysR family regulator